jgi:hypothetical protein
MITLNDYRNRKIRLTDERLQHIEENHPEMSGQLSKIKEALKAPDQIVQSMSDSGAELYYKDYKKTPVTHKYICIVVKNIKDNLFMITAYFTDTIKRGETKWKKE